MNFKIYTYKEALQLIKPNLYALKQNRKLAKLCRTHKLSYHAVQQISSDKNTKEYPDTLYRLLKIFDYKIQREKAFKVFDSNEISLK